MQQATKLWIQPGNSMPLNQPLTSCNGQTAKSLKPGQPLEKTFIQVEKQHLVALLAENRSLKQQVLASTQKQTQQKQRIKELTTFAHNVAHEVRGPLSIILGYVDIFLAEDDSLPADLKHYGLKTIAGQTKKIDALIADLFLLATFDESNSTTLEQLDMGAIVKQVLSHLQPVIADRQAEIVLPDDWPQVLGYAPWLEIVWSNYLSNALKYGGDPPQIELGATRQEDGLICFWVRDNGPGLTAEEQSQLFNPFVRFNPQHISGYGLGLYIVRRIVEKLGGEVKAESDPLSAHGSLFSFTLPIDKT